MTNQERIEKYKKSIVQFDCEIRIFKNNDTICTKCVYYERQN